MKQLTYLILALLLMLSMSCEKDKAIDLNAMLTQGKWRMAAYTASPGVRMGTTANSPLITDAFAIYVNNSFADELYQFLSNGTLKIEYLNSSWDDDEGSWSLSSDQKTLILYGESFQVLSVKDGEFVLGGKEMMFDRYLQEEVLQETKVTLKRF